MANGYARAGAAQALGSGLRGLGAMLTDRRLRDEEKSEREREIEALERLARAQELQEPGVTTMPSYLDTENRRLATRKPPRTAKSAVDHSRDDSAILPESLTQIGDAGARDVVPSLRAPDPVTLTPSKGDPVTFQERAPIVTPHGNVRSPRMAREESALGQILTAQMTEPFRDKPNPATVRGTPEWLTAEEDLLRLRQKYGGRETGSTTPRSGLVGEVLELYGHIGPDGKWAWPPGTDEQWRAQAVRAYMAGGRMPPVPKRSGSVTVPVDPVTGTPVVAPGITVKGPGEMTLPKSESNPQGRTVGPGGPGTAPAAPSDTVSLTQEMIAADPILKGAMQRAADLAQKGYSSAQIAEMLEREGHGGLRFVP